MPKITRPLTVKEIEKAKPREAAYRLFDGGGLYLEVTPTGSKWWRLKFRHAGIERRAGLGVWPAVTLEAARQKREEYRALIAAGINPIEAGRSSRAQAEEDAENSFEAVATEWHAKKAHEWTPTHATKIQRWLALDAFPKIGARPVGQITSKEMLAMLRKIEQRGAVDTAHRIHQVCSQVFRYAVATGRADADPTAALRGALKAPVRENQAAVKPAEVPQLLRDIDQYPGLADTTRLGLHLLSLTMVRTIELRGARWDEIDFDAGMWTIPKERMKMRDPHHVPLSRQAVQAFRRLHEINGRREFVFPGERDPKRPMSENAMLYALHRMGYKGRMTGHGFRAVASTMLNECGYRADVIERQLAHTERNKVRAAYNRAEYLPERTKMLQAWADMLDALRQGSGGKVTRLHRKVAA